MSLIVVLILLSQESSLRGLLMKTQSLGLLPEDETLRGSGAVM